MDSSMQVEQAFFPFLAGATRGRIKDGGGFCETFEDTVLEVEQWNPLLSELRTGMAMSQRQVGTKTARPKELMTSGNRDVLAAHMAVLEDSSSSPAEERRRKRRRESQQKKEWDTAKRFVSGLDFRLRQPEPIQLLEYQMVRALCRFDTLGNLVSSHRPTSDMYPPQFCGGSQAPGG